MVLAVGVIAVNPGGILTAQMTSGGFRVIPFRDHHGHEFVAAEANEVHRPNNTTIDRMQRREIIAGKYHPSVHSVNAYV